MKNWLTIAVVCTSTMLFAQSPLDHFLSHPAIANANVSVEVRRLSTGETMDCFRANHLQTPASVLKLLSTATAIQTWGSAHRFSTKLSYSGTIRNGVLDGNLYIEGQGDPTLGGERWGKDAFLQQWIQVIEDAGIHQINGQVIADASYYDKNEALNSGWIYEDIGNYYAPGIFAIAYSDNTTNYQLSSGQVGSNANVVRISPTIADLEIDNSVHCADITYDGAYVHGLPLSNERRLVGVIPARRGTFTLRGDIPNPPLLLAEHFTQRLQESGITVTHPAAVLFYPDETNRKTIYTHRSASLEQIVQQTNTHSINLNAEMLFRNLAAQRHIPCQIDHAVQYIKGFWKERGIDFTSANILDGCGLAPQNGISAHQLVELLTFMAQSDNRDCFIQSLPISGQSGTLKSWLANTELAGKVHAKSGYIKSTRNYAGYMDMPDGDQLIFAVMVNNTSAGSDMVKKAIEDYLLDVYRRSK